MNCWSDKRLKDRDLVAGYICRSLPFQWLRWLARIRDKKTRKGLHRILFDEQEQLRDLTRPAIRREVLRCATKYAALRRIVAAEARSVIQEAVAKMLRQWCRKKALSFSQRMASPRKRKPSGLPRPGAHLRAER